MVLSAVLGFAFAVEFFQGYFRLDLFLFALLLPTCLYYGSRQLHEEVLFANILCNGAHAFLALSAIIAYGMAAEACRQAAALNSGNNTNATNSSMYGPKHLNRSNTSNATDGDELPDCGNAEVGYFTFMSFVFAVSGLVSVCS